MAPPNILIFGTGSLGIVYTWILSQAVPASSHLTAVCRSNYAAASSSPSGFTVHSSLWGRDLHVRPRIVRSVDEAISTCPNGGYFDYILITSKALPTRPSTPSILAPALRGRPRTAIVLIQNGVGIEDEWRAAYPENPLLSCVAYLPATQVRPAVVEHREVELLHVGTYPPSSTSAGTAEAEAAAESFVSLLTRAGATAKLHADVQGERWAKLLVNASWNPICALTRLRDREFMDTDAAAAEGGGGGGDGEATALVRDVMLEIAAVARACGYEGIDGAMVEYQMGRAKARGLPGVQPSMLADVLAEGGGGGGKGKMLEVEAIVGNAYRMGRERGVSMPALRVVYLLGRGLSRGLEMGR
ncbi:2-dehydropantoate 2-reductase [Xylariomycetidae sp. FL2044]|nr:2-dehydropantoate 2-reductase [Xylariomycetidae sp. FL2044]